MNENLLKPHATMENFYFTKTNLLSFQGIHRTKCSFQYYTKCIVYVDTINSNYLFLDPYKDNMDVAEILFNMFVNKYKAHGWTVITLARDFQQDTFNWGLFVWHVEAPLDLWHCMPNHL